MTLHLTLHKIWFDKIVTGEKTEEYRRRTDFWKNRLNGRHYEQIQFRNGYNKDAPTMRVQCLGISEGQWEGEPCYVLKLGQILEIRRPKEDQASISARQQDSDTQAQLPIFDAATNG